MRAHVMRCRYILLGVLALAVCCLASCRSRGSSPNLHGTAREVLVVAVDIDALSLDPAVAYEFVSVDVDMNLYDTLIRYENDDFTKPLPSLAERWEISPDGLRYIFHLRRGVRFASGSPLDANAVKFSLDRTLKMNMAPASVISDNLAPQRIFVLDPYTIEMRLLHPSSYFLCTLFSSAAGVVDPTVVKEHTPEWLGEHSAGSGPFVLRYWDRDTAIVLERNEKYWGGAEHTSGGPRVRRVIIKDVKESTTRRMMLERGDADIAYDLSPLEINAALAASANVRTVEGPYLRIFYVGMNLRRGPFKDERVRQAVRYAIDYDGLVKLMAHGRALPLQGPIIKGLFGYTPDLGVVRHDPLRARELLRAAGYVNGFDTVLYASSGSTAFGPTRDEICAKLQSDLKSVGIRAQVKMLSGAAYLELYRAKKTDMNMGDWGADYPDPFNFAHPFGHSAGILARRVDFTDARLDPLIEAAGREINAERRLLLYTQIQRRLMELGPWAFLLQPTRMLPLRAEVHGYRYNAMSPMEYGDVWKAEP